MPSHLSFYRYGRRGYRRGRLRFGLSALGTCGLWRAVVAVFRSGLCVRLFRCVLGCGFGQSLRQSAIAKPAHCLRFMPSLAPATSLRSSLRSRHSTQHHARQARLRPVAVFPTRHRPPSAHALPPLHSSSCNAPVNSQVCIFKDKARPAPFAIFSLNFANLCNDTLRKDNSLLSPCLSHAHCCFVAGAAVEGVICQ